MTLQRHIYRTIPTTPRTNIIFCPAGWLRCFKFRYIYFDPAGLCGVGGINPFRVAAGHEQWEVPPAPPPVPEHQAASASAARAAAAAPAPHRSSRGGIRTPGAQLLGVKRANACACRAGWGNPAAKRWAGGAEEVKHQGCPHLSNTISTHEQ